MPGQDLVPILLIWEDELSFCDDDDDDEERLRGFLKLGALTGKSAKINVTHFNELLKYTTYIVNVMIGYQVGFSFSMFSVSVQILKCSVKLFSH